jgi:hypothetical protein
MSAPLSPSLNRREDLRGELINISDILKCIRILFEYFMVLISIPASDNL